MPSNPVQGAGYRFVGPKVIILTIIFYLIPLSAIIVYSLYRPFLSLLDPLMHDQNPLMYEEQLFILVASAGALGSLVRALRFFYWYVGNRELV